MKFKFFISLFLISILILNITVACEIGEKTNTQYCDINGEWQELKPDDTTCSNNFECQTNLCENNICTSENIIEKLMKHGYILNQIITLLTGEEPPTEGPTNGGAAPSSGDSTGAGDSYTIEKTFSNIDPNKLYEIKINELPIPVVGISFILNTYLANVKFIIKRMIGLDSKIPEPEGLVYMYFHIDPDGVVEKYIEQANILFRVEKNWLEENDVLKYKIVLQRYTNKWNIIKPQLIMEDDFYYYYDTVTPGFSWFAITSSPPKPKYVPVIQPMCGDGIIDSGENCENCPEDVVCEKDEICYEGRCVIKKKTPLIWFITPVIILVLLAILWYIFKKHKKTTIKELKPTYKQIKKITTKPSRKPLFSSKTSMINLKNYIKKSLIAKVPKTKIKALLMSKGWKVKQIEYIFKKLKK